MDIISFNEAATANGRIERILAEPDSTSGLVTMPSTIAVGETVTIPAGRVVVHPNLQVDGTLDIQGDLFIPSGGTSDQLVAKSGDTMTGNLNFSGTGLRITGDFSNATGANRLYFKTSTENATTDIGIAPSGTGAKAGIFIRSYDLDLSSNGNLVRFSSSDLTGLTTISTEAIGTGTPQQMVFNVNGAERLRIDTSGNVLVTGSGGLGYGTGSGGTVTQLISKGTLVTLDKPCGQIIMHNASLAANGIIAFRVNNTAITTNDVVSLSLHSGFTDGGSYNVWSAAIGDGYCYILVKNITAGALAEAIKLNFAVIKGATA